MGWLRFCRQIQKDLKLWLLIVVLMGCTRGAIMMAFHSRWSDGTEWTELLTACLRGLRFDAQLATVWCSASLIFSMLSGWRDCTAFSDRLRSWLVIGFAAIAIPVIAIDIGYFFEYHNQFDHFLFGAIYDDQGAILDTIWATYHPLRYLFGAAAGGMAVWWLGSRWIRSPFLPDSWIENLTRRYTIRIFISLALLTLVVGSGRGSFARRPLQIKDSAVVTDRLLNTWVPTPFHAFGHALQTWRDMRSINGITSYIPDGNLAKAAAEVFPQIGNATTVDDFLKRTAPGFAQPPRHVYLVIMESFDAWPLMPQWKDLHLTDQIAELGKSGLLITDFVPIGTGTMSSLSAILTGLPDVGVYTAYRPSARQAFPSSPAAIFKRLGYRTRFFYAGYLSWQRIGDFCHDQGFDELYGGGHIGNPSGNEWGVEDEALFDFALKTANDDAPTFNVILSTSNHPPYNVDVDAKGFPLHEIPAWAKHESAGGFSRSILGHMWYSDRCAGSFIRAIEAKLPKTVVALTGDHWSRRTMNTRPSCYERSSVPLLLRGPQVLTNLPPANTLAGGHLDIAPTLIELCAPNGFVYHACGENILRPHRGAGLGAGRIIGPNFLFEFNHDSISTHPTTTDVIAAPTNPEAMKRWYDTVYGLGWWRLMRGNQLFTPEH